MNGKCRYSARLLLLMLYIYFHKYIEVQNITLQKFMTFSSCVFSNVPASIFIQMNTLLLVLMKWQRKKCNIYMQLNICVLFEVKLARRTGHFFFVLSLFSLLLSVRCCIWKLMKVKIAINCVYKELVLIWKLVRLTLITL